MTAAVVDASAVVELLRATDTGTRIQARLFEAETTRHIPDCCPLEVTSALRGLVLAKKLDAGRGELAVFDLMTFPAHRHRSEPLLARTWELRANLTVHDATYVALAESLDATLVTSDRKFDTPTVRRLVDVEVLA